MNLRKQVEPLKKAALQASSLQRHAHHAASRLTWVKRWLKRAYRHHAQSRELKRFVHLTLTGFGVQGSARAAAGEQSALPGDVRGGKRAASSSLGRHEDAIEEALELAGAL